jgi:glucokinase
VIGALDIGGTKIAIGIYDDHGKLYAKEVIPTDAKAGAEAATFRIASSLYQMMRLEPRLTGTTLDGIGIGCTGPVYPKTGKIGLTDLLPGWEGFCLSQAIEAKTGLKVFLENDADAAALGEWAWGAGLGSRSFLLVTIGTGIGAGVILDGRLYRGVDGSHPEIGHHFIDPGGPACACGGVGCWESLASGPAMEAWAQARHPQRLRRSAKELCQAAEQGDRLVTQAVEREAYYLGLGIANLVTTFSPEIIALTGGVMRSQHLFLPKILEMVARMTTYVPNERVKIVAIPDQADAGLRGAAQVWIHNQSSNQASSR